LGDLPDLRRRADVRQLQGTSPGLCLSTDKI